MKIKIDYRKRILCAALQDALEELQSSGFKANRAYNSAEAQALYDAEKSFFRAHYAAIMAAD